MNRKKVLTLISVVLLSLLVLAGCKGKEKEELVLYTWANMLPQEVLDDFTKETGIEVVYANFDTSENMLEKMSRGESGNYDIIITDDYMIDILRNQNLIQKLDKAQIPNFGNINPFYQGYFFDPTDEYTVPYGSGIPLIVYNSEKVDFPVTSYKDLWRPEFRNSLAMIANYRVIHAVALLSMHESINSSDPDVLEEAGKLLLELSPNVRVLNDSGLELALLSGEAKAGFVFTSQVTALQNEDPKFKAVVPEEGVGIGIMGAVISKDAPNLENAHKFLDYILQPEISAKCFEYIGYYSTTKPADGMVSSDLIFPEDLTGEIMQDVTPEANEQMIENYMNFQNAIQ